MTIRVLTGDCRDVLRTLPDASVDSVVTDPPYGLTQNKKGGTGVRSVNLDSPYGRARIGTGNGSGGFMGLAWDKSVPGVEVWRECLRVLKPGGHLLSFAGTRTQHRMACAIEDAGFEIRDMLFWHYGQGFPKSLNVGNGLGTALKPATEPITLARKPLAEKTVASQVLATGTGALNVDKCRVEGGARPLRESRSDTSKHAYGNGLNGSCHAGKTTSGRWPPNLLHDGSEEVVGLFPVNAGGGTATRGASSRIYGGGKGFTQATGETVGYGDQGSAARFFPRFKYCPKASKADRGEGNNHPTVKPTDLMRWLVRLVTPPGGTVLDPFAGTGTTGIAAAREGFHAVLIEREEAYVEIARARLAADGGLFAEVAAE